MTGQAALVTGSSRGIGLAAAKKLAEAGFAIALNGPFDDEELEKARLEIASLGVPVTKAVFNVAELSKHAQQIEAVERDIGPLTTLVNNAGVSVLNRGDLLDVSEESYDRCMAINTKAVFFLSQAFGRTLVARARMEGLFHSIINVTSANAKAVSVQRSEYCASKAAASMITQCLAVRFGAEGIFVYDVQPGLIDTAMTQKVIAQYEEQAKEGLTLIPRIGRPEDVGATIASLASGMLPYSTGQVISADAGMLVPRF